MESNLMLLIFSLICIHLAGKLIEPLWGMRELIKFYSFNVLVTAFFCSFVSFLFYAVKTDLTMFFSWSVNGFLGLAAGIQMAVKQILPDSVLMNFGGLGRLKNTHIPLLNFVLQIIFTLMGLTTVASCFMYLSGMYFSWIYLRFYQRHSNGQRGDSSDHFSFASLFPKVLQPIVGVGASLFFRTLVKLKICRPQVKRYNLAQAGGSLISTGGPVADAQRQRQKALRDLNTRLTKSKAVEESLEWPNLMDESASPTSPAASPSPPKSPAERQEQQDRPKSADLVQVV